MKKPCRLAAGTTFAAADAALCKRRQDNMEKVVEKMSHAVATCFQIAERGFITGRLLGRSGDCGSE